MPQALALELRHRVVKGRHVTAHVRPARDRIGDHQPGYVRGEHGSDGLTHRAPPRSRGSSGPNIANPRAGGISAAIGPRGRRFSLTLARNGPNLTNRHPPQPRANYTLSVSS